MGFFSNVFQKLFSKGEDPLPIFDHPQLGHMTWSEDDESWGGTYNGIPFFLEYDFKSAPTPEVLAYAMDILSDPDFLTSTLDEAKREWLSELPPARQVAEQPQLAKLTFDRVSFWIKKGQGYVSASLKGNDDALDRYFRIEYQDRRCLGIGYDT
jgi:hypothetical protein